jgi:O-methyltransferase
MTDVPVVLYLDLLKRCVTNLIYRDPAVRYIGDDLDEGLIGPFSLSRRVAAKDWPSQAHTMIGTRRLDNIQALVEQILQTQVPGDLIERGVWRGGSTIFMRGVLKAYGVTDRTVWVADSFAGGGGAAVLVAGMATTAVATAMATARRVIMTPRSVLGARPFVLRGPRRLFGSG